MTGFLLLLINAAVLVGAVAAAIVIHGGWEAAAAGIAVVAGMTCLVTFVVLLTEADGAPRSPHARG